MSDTKDKLLAATADTLREAGIAGLSARAIATRAGVNQALIFYHFTTVADLVVAATKRTVDESVGYYRAEFAKACSLVELLQIGRGLHEREQELGNVRLMSQLMAGGQQDAILAEAAAYALSTWSEEIETVVRRLLAGSPLELIADPRGLAKAVSASFIGLELYEGIDPVAGRSALDALEQLGMLVEVMDDLGPVARRALRARIKRSKVGLGKSDTVV